MDGAVRAFKMTWNRSPYAPAGVGAVFIVRIQLRGAVVKGQELRPPCIVDATGRHILLPSITSSYAPVRQPVDPAQKISLEIDHLVWIIYYDLNVLNIDTQ